MAKKPRKSDNKIGIHLDRQQVANAIFDYLKNVHGFNYKSGTVQIDAVILCDLPRIVTTHLDYRGFNISLVLEEDGE